MDASAILRRRLPDPLDLARGLGDAGKVTSAAIGEVTEEHNGKFKVTLGPETEVLHPPGDKDVDEQMIVDLRRMLDQAGYADESAVEDSSDRNHGDSRWGKPE